MPYQHGITISEVNGTDVGSLQSTAGIHVIVGKAPVNLAADPYSCHQDSSTNGSQRRRRDGDRDPRSKLADRSIYSGRRCSYQPDHVPCGTP